MSNAPRYTIENKTIERLRRLPNSKSGNPHFKVFFTDGTARLTRADAAIAGMLENSEYQQVMCSFTIQEGLIVGAVPLSRP